MMEKIIITVEKSTRKTNFTRNVIGNDLENLQQQLVFKFTDEFVNGSARLEYKIGGNKYHIPMTKEGETYAVPIKNVITKEGKILMQLVIVQAEVDEEIPVFKSNVFEMYCNKSINAQTEAPDDYIYWLDVIQTKLAEIDDALEEVDNLDIEATRVSDGVEVSITDKSGTTTTTKVNDGKDAKINGVNALTIEAGENIGLTQDGSTLTINNTYDDSDILGDIADLKEEDIDLQSQIDAIASSSDVVDVVGTYTELQNYDTSKLTENDVVKVLQDSTHSNAISYYRWVSNAWSYIGSEGPFYTKSETDTLLGEKQNTLVSGTNIKTINSQSVLGSGDIVIGGNVEDVKVNGTSVLDTNKVANIDLTGYVENEEFIDSQEEQDKHLNNVSTLSNLFDDKTGSGTDLSINDTEDTMLRLGLNGNIYQADNPSSGSPKDIEVVKGNNEIKIQSKNISTLQEAKYTMTNTYYTHYATGIQITKEMVNKKISVSYNLKISNYSGVNTYCSTVIGYGSTATNMTTQLKTSSYLISASVISVKMENITIPNVVGNYLVLRPVAFSNQSSANIEATNIMIEYGESATDFVKHQEQAYPINIGNMEMVNIPNTDYKDSFIYENNKWYKHAMIGKIASYNGETITTDYISTTGGLDVGATVYYGLTTPTNIEIPDTNLIGQLNDLKYALAYKDQTNISQTNDEQPFIIDYETYVKVPTKTSELTNDSGFITNGALTDYAKKNQNNNFSASQTINGDLLVYGDITNTGSSYETHAEKIYTKNDYIITRDGAVSGLASGDYTGFQATKYDGTNDGRLVFDNTGTARVGDVGDEVPLLARDESTNMTDGKIVTWDGTNLIAKTTIGMVTLTQQQYDALQTKDANTYYNIVEE